MKRILSLIIVLMAVSFANEIELVEKRTFFTKDYQLESGSFKKLISPRPIHYIDNGIYVDIPTDELPTMDSLLTLAYQQLTARDLDVIINYSDGSYYKYWDNFWEEYRYDSDFSSYVGHYDFWAEGAIYRAWCEYDPSYSWDYNSNISIEAIEIDINPTIWEDFPHNVKVRLQDDFEEQSWVSEDDYENLNSDGSHLFNFDPNELPISEHTYYPGSNVLNIFEDNWENSSTFALTFTEENESSGDGYIDMWNTYLWVYYTENVEYLELLVINSYYGENIGGEILYKESSSNSWSVANSGDYIQILVNTDYDFKTSEIIGDKKHNYWDGYYPDEIFLLLDNKNSSGLDEARAEFRYDEQIALNCSADIQDPWFVRANGAQTGTDWIVIDNNYIVFLDQNSAFNSIYPIYTLRTDRYLIEDNELTGIFKNWSGVNGEVDFGGGASTTNLLETNVVFKEVNTTIDAEYMFKEPVVFDIPDAIDEVVIIDPFIWNGNEIVQQEISIGSSYNVFLNQNSEFDFALPIYRLKAPNLYADENGIYGFSHWGGNDISYETPNQRETKVVFTSENAHATANYSIIHTQNVDALIPEDEELIIPAGVQYLCHEGFTLRVEGTLIIAGSSSNRASMTIPTQTNQPDIIHFIEVLEGGRMIGSGLHLIADYDIGSPALIKAREGSIVNLSHFTFSTNGISVWVENAHVELSHCVFTSYSTPIFQTKGIYATQTDIFHTTHSMESPFYNQVIIKSSTFRDLDVGIEIDLNITNQGREVWKGLDVTNSIITDNTTGLLGTGSINNYILLDYVNMSNETNYDLSESIIANHIQTDNPLLNNNHDLTENSPCIDAGDPDSPLDPDGTRLDMGAFYFDKVPNAPTGFTILGDVGDHPELTWDEHEESDVNEFLIYRSLNYGAFLLTATVSQTNWVDTEVTINNEKKFSNRACYYIKAVDAMTQESPSTSPQCESVNIGLKKQAFTLIPKEYEWSSVHPNPFNPKTTIQYGLPVSSHISFTIHNMVGQLVKTIQSRDMPAGYHSIQWNSLNDAGEKVPSGMYIVQMKAISTNGKKHFTNAQKVVLLK